MPEEVQAFRAEKEMGALTAARAKAQKREPGQLGLLDAFKRIRTE